MKDNADRRRRLKRVLALMPLPPARVRKTVEEWVVIAEELAKKNRGVLPHIGWLRHNGYVALATAMFTYPKAFAHIKQNRKKKTVEEWVIVAEGLARKNHGVLQNAGWLDARGYSGLYQVMHAHPEAFAHIQQNRKQKTLGEWVVVAENLTAKNRGLLQNSNWLQKNGYSALVRMRKYHPEAFAHIKQDRKIKTLEEHVVVAEGLAERNRDVLPNMEWLQQNGYSGLVFTMYKDPEAFAHIKQDRKIKTLEEHVVVAEGLAKKNHGVLKNVKWVVQNGEGLQSAMQKHPEAFAHIKQARLRKTLNEQVAVAKNLAKKNHGVLQNCAWLHQNGYYGIYLMMRKHPRAFRNIKQERKCQKSKTLEEHITAAEHLAKKNRGILPNVWWLRQNGYAGLSRATRNHPRAFRHIKQLKLDSHGKLISKGRRTQ
jgi:hypothetical protein